MSRAALSPTPRSTVHRHRDRAATDRADLDAILDAGLICHLGFVVDGAPVVLPTGYGRDGDTVYLHGSSAAHSLRLGATGVPVCVTVTIVDGLVYARSVFSHSMNYRSAVVHGTARAITEDAAKLRGLRVLTEAMAPGSWDYTRTPNRKELAKTLLLAVDLTEASVKVRAGGPGDPDADLDDPAVWAGVLPLHRVWGQPEPAGYADPATPVPGHIAHRPNLDRPSC